MVQGPRGASREGCGSSDAHGYGAVGGEHGPKSGGRGGGVEGSGFLLEGHGVPDLAHGDTEPKLVVPVGESVDEPPGASDARRQFVPRQHVCHRVNGRHCGGASTRELRDPDVSAARGNVLSKIGQLPNDDHPRTRHEKANLSVQTEGGYRKSLSVGLSSEFNRENGSNHEAECPKSPGVDIV